MNKTLQNEIRAILAGAKGRALTENEKGQLDALTKALANASKEEPEQLISNRSVSGGRKSEIRDLIASGRDFAEFRTGVPGLSSSGTAQVIADGFADKVIQKMRLLSGLYDIGNRMICNGQSLHVPVLLGTQTAEQRANPAGDDLSEIDCTGESMADVEIPVSDWIAMLKVSENAIADAAFDVEGVLSEALARAVAAKFEAVNIAALAALTTVSSVAIGTETLGTSSVTATDLLAMHAAMNPMRQQNAVWIMKPATWAHILGLQQAVDGAYILNTFEQGIPQKMLLGNKVLLSNDMPALGTGNKAIALLDPNAFVIAQRQELEVRVLQERYLDQGAIGLRAKIRCGAALTVAEGLVLGVCA